MNVALSLVMITAACAIAAVWLDVRVLRAVASRLLARAFYLENIREAKSDGRTRATTTG